jgi:hypothetical protein
MSDVPLVAGGKRGPQFDGPQALSVPQDNPPGRTSKDPASKLDDDDLLAMFDRWDMALTAHWSQWIEEARGWYDFRAGTQWTEIETQRMEENSKIPVTFNLTEPAIDAVNGAEIQDRQQVQYYPRNTSLQSTGIADVLTQGANYVVDQCNGDQEDTEAFLDALTCGVGWTETRVEVEGSVASIVKERVDPLQIKADPASRKRCFEDKRYLKREIPMTRDEFEDFKEEINRPDLEEGDLDGQDSSGKRLTVVNPRQRYTHGLLGEGEDTEVIVCEWQWWVRETIKVAAMPHPTDPTVTKLTPLSDQEFADAKKTNPALRSVPSTRRTYYRAFEGDGQILFKETMPEQDFRYKAITAKRDRNKGTYYGLVKPMVEPNKFVNKLFSEVLHIVRTNASGGMTLEEDAVSDIRQFETSWANTQKVTWVKSGALSGAHGAKMQPKSPPQVQPALFQLMSFAKDMVQACTGVNEEILGLVGREQAGVLEQQRKQAAYGILSSFFDAKRRYQRNQGKLLLTMMRLYLPDDFMVRIVLEGEQQYVPLAMGMQSDEYDVVVDEAPAAPNTKARVAAVLMPLVTQLLQAQLISPNVLANLVQYLDIPASVAQQLAQAITQQVQVMQTPNPAVVAKQQSEIENTQADTANKKASAQEKQAKAFKSVTDAHAQHIGLGVDFMHVTTPPGPPAPAPGSPAAQGAPGPGGPAPAAPGGGGPALPAGGPGVRPTGAPVAPGLRPQSVPPGGPPQTGGPPRA